MGQKKQVSAQSKAFDGRFIRLGKKEWGLRLIEDVGISILIAWIFYDSVWGLLCIPVVFVINAGRIRQSQEMQRQMKFDTEFKEVLVALSAALQSGYSVENAFLDVEENLRLLYGSNALILQDLREMNVKISMRESAEKAFAAFAQKYPSEETLGFSQIFSFGKRLGGDYMKNLRRTIEKIEDKLDLKQEIAMATAEKQMELKVMSVMPFFILTYIKLSSSEFLASLYHNPIGIFVMTGCIFVYLACIYVGKKFVTIEV